MRLCGPRLAWKQSPEKDIRDFDRHGWHSWQEGTETQGQRITQVSPGRARKGVLLPSSWPQSRYQGACREITLNLPSRDPQAPAALLVNGHSGGD